MTEKEKVNDTKPPLGLMPHNIWVVKRLQDIVYVINRYIEANKEIPLSWIREYNTLIEWTKTFQIKED